MIDDSEHGGLRRIAVALVCLILMLATASAADAQGLSKEALNDITIDQKLNEQVPLDLDFRDETGSSVRLGEYFGTKPVILNLVYYECPMLCTQVLNGLVGALLPMAFTVGQEFNVVTVSIDPTETPELASKKKLDYLTRYHRAGAEQGWHFLTGSQKSIDRLASAVGFRYMYDSTSKQYAHASAIMVLTPKGKVAAYQFGVEYDTKNLKIALADASNEKIGSLVERLIWRCYEYDPLTGGYGLSIRKVLQIAGVLTVTVLVGFISFWLVRERRKNKFDPRLTALTKEARN
jgi:protein SCO1/2